MKYFGTDGIRGAYGGPVINEEFFEKLGMAVSLHLNGKISRSPKRLAIAGDPRFSSESLKAAFCKGLRGVDVLDFGVVPTPALAFGVLDQQADFGVMITASHNPSSDNGVKFFDAKAQKISDAAQDEIENFLNMGVEASGSIANIQRTNMRARYVEKMGSILPAGSLNGLKVALDCANGATAGISGTVLRNCGAEVFEMAVNPDGRNINENVGSEHTPALSSLVVQTGSSVGLAHDGDGDRLVVCDENGLEIPGECVLGFIAVEAKYKGALKGNAIVTTVQSNMGLDATLKNYGISVYRSGIGDRLVMKMMIEKSCGIGGENSGHYIFTDISPCGDGLSAALKLLAALAGKGLKASEMAKLTVIYPSVSKAVKVSRKTPIADTPTLAATIKDCEEKLNGAGRVLVRYSGTEDKIRLLVEGSDPLLINDLMNELLKSVGNDLQ